VHRNRGTTHGRTATALSTRGRASRDLNRRRPNHHKRPTTAGLTPTKRTIRYARAGRQPTQCGMACMWRSAGEVTSGFVRSVVKTGMASFSLRPPRVPPSALGGVWRSVDRPRISPLSRNVPRRTTCRRSLMTAWRKESTARSHLDPEVQMKGVNPPNPTGSSSILTSGALSSVTASSVLVPQAHRSRVGQRFYDRDVGPSPSFCVGRTTTRRRGV